jgi:alpha-glucosidase
MENHLNYYISYENKRMLDISSIDLELENNVSLAAGDSISSSSVKQINEQIISPVPEKRKIIPDIYSLLTIQFIILLRSSSECMMMGLTIESPLQSMIQ